MRAGRNIFLVAVVLCGAEFLGFARFRTLQAQNVAIGTPTVRIGDSSFQQFRGGFGGNGGGSDAQLGFSILGDGGALNFNLSAAQGSSRSISSVTPMVVVPNGGTGTFMNVTQRPFVIGFTPVVGGWSDYIVVPPRVPSFSIGPTVSPLQERIQRLANGEGAAEITDPDDFPKRDREADASESTFSDRKSTRRSTAEQPDVSVEQIRRQLQAQDAAESAAIAAYVAAARQAEAAGDLSRAVKLIDKARRASRGPRRRAFEDELRALRAKIGTAQGES